MITGSTLTGAGLTTTSGSGWAGGRGAAQPAMNAATAVLMASQMLLRGRSLDAVLICMRNLSGGSSETVRSFERCSIPVPVTGDILCTGIVAPERVRNNQEQTGTTFVGAFVNDSTIFFARLASAPAVLVTVTRVEGLSLIHI